MDIEIVTHSDIAMTSFSTSAELYQYLNRFFDIAGSRHLS
jgi:hypothetical protein